jgi:hypothetical protein
MSRYSLCLCKRLKSRGTVSTRMAEHVRSNIMLTARMTKQSFRCTHTRDVHHGVVVVLYTWNERLLHCYALRRNTIMAASRICSLLPSATEIVGCLGLANRLVCITHECDLAPDEKTVDDLLSSGTVARVTSSAINPSILSQACLCFLVACLEFNRIFCIRHWYASTYTVWSLRMGSLKLTAHPLPGHIAPSPIREWTTFH